MHIHEMNKWLHSHRFIEDNRGAEKRTRWVVGLTAITMLVEILAGLLSGSMALLADGFHMGTHMFALGISVFAYRFARRHQDDPIFTFGTGKVSSLAGFTSAVVLGLVAFGMICESFARLISPREIHFSQAILVAFVGLAVNLGSALLLRDAEPHASAESHHQDHNLKAAYLHVVADALTSLLAVFALFAVRFLSLSWMDPCVGILGALLISFWAFGLLRETARTLLDAGVDPETIEKIRRILETDADNRISDLHVWRVGGDALCLAATIVTHYPRNPKHYRELLKDIPPIKHTTIEIVACEGKPCMPITAEPTG
ncbi:MAG: CDF family Co(II)/Ni(II) efflux transporter DmeF [Deltaproteobacteria bacterium]|nr:CDF family Co(II)/Ni(II) efflux transporter DmeF [Deltaproteobacteria bacterium]